MESQAKNGVMLRRALEAEEMQDSHGSKLMTIPEATRELPVSISSLQKHAARGTVRVIRLGKRIFLRQDEIDRIRREGLPSLR